MPISDGQSAHPSDIWFRVLTDKNYIKQGAIHPSAFTGRQIARPDDSKGRSWDHELSGRLRSLSTDVVAEAKAYCAELTKRLKQDRPFSGVMFCSVEQTATALDKPLSAGVNYTPLSDAAHGDFTFYGTAQVNEDTWKLIHLKLAQMMTGLHAAQMHLLPAASVSRDEYTVPEPA
jgi:hypothetical protein